MGLQWGDVPGGIGAILTGISLLIAALSYRRSVDNAEMAQAELVTSWIENDDQHKAIIFIRNSSNLPVYLLAVHLDDEQSLRRFYVGTLLPSSTKEIKTDIWLESAMPPDKIDFIDAAGRSWIRTDEGRLLRFRNEYRRIRFKAAIHPIKLGRLLMPSRFDYPQRYTAPDVDNRLQGYAIEIAELRGHDKKSAESAIKKYVGHRKLNYFEKMALGDVLDRVPDLRPLEWQERKLDNANPSEIGET
jgi:hypothetical protein